MCLTELVGFAGLSYSDALEIEFSDYEEITKGVKRRENEEWKRARFIATMIVNMSGKSVKNNLRPDQILRIDEPHKKASGQNQNLRSALRRLTE